MKKDRKPGKNSRRVLMRQPAFLLMTALILLLGATAAWFLSNTVVGNEPMGFESLAPLGENYTLYKWDSTAPEPYWQEVSEVDFDLQVPNAVYRYKIVVSNALSAGDYTLNLDLQYPQTYTDTDMERVDELYKYLYIKTIGTAAEGEADPVTGKITNHITYGAVTPGAAGAVREAEEAAGIYVFTNSVNEERSALEVATEFEASGSGDTIVSYFDLYIHKDATIAVKDQEGNIVQQDISSLDISGVLSITAAH